MMIHSPCAEARSLADRTAQRGATLIIALIVLVLISLIVASGFSLSSSNLKSVGNIQVHQEGVAAAEQAVELLVSSPFTDDPVAQSIEVDINKDGATDYVTNIAKPTCIRAIQDSASAPSDVELPVSMSAGSTWNTDWDINATVTDTASGATVTLREGVRVLLTQTQKSLVCP